MIYLPAVTVLTCEDFGTGREILRKEFPYGYSADFSKDYLNVIIYEPEPGSEPIDYDIYEIHAKTGKEISRKHVTGVDYDSMHASFKESTAPEPDSPLGDEVTIISPDKKYIFECIRTSGILNLRPAKDKKLIRGFRFESDIE